MPGRLSRGMADFCAPDDLRVAKTAARQYGVVSVRQLRDAGMDADAVRLRVRAGRLHRLHRGVYAVGHRGLSWRGRWLAAVFAAGDGAVLGHRSAAELWGFLRPEPGSIDITVPGRSGRRPRRGIRFHRPRRLGGISETRYSALAAGSSRAPFRRYPVQVASLPPSRPSLDSYDRAIRFHTGGATRWQRR